MPSWLSPQWLCDIHIHIHTNLPVNATVRLPHHWNGDSQGQETFLASSADKQTCNHDTKCSNAIYSNLPVNAIVRLPHPQTGDSQGQEMFLALSADKQTHNYDTECSNHHPSLSTLRSKGLSHSKMKWLAIYTNLPVNAIVRIPHPQSGDSQGQETFLAPSTDKQTCNHDTKCSNHHPSLSNLSLSLYIYICCGKKIGF